MISLRSYALIISTLVSENVFDCDIPEAMVGERPQRKAPNPCRREVDVEESERAVAAETATSGPSFL